MNPNSRARVFLVFSAVTSIASASELPPNAMDVIGKVSAAAAKRDFGALEGLMAPEFTWSFGGDRDARQALKAWRADPNYLQQLHLAIRGLCALKTSDGVVECPTNSGTKYRAGFKATQNGWKMIYFVAGD
jgi:hypothetical protein